MMVCDIRGWGRIQFINKCEERQDAIGETVAKLLNESRDDQNEYQDEGPERTNFENFRTAIDKENATTNKVRTADGNFRIRMEKINPGLLVMLSKQLLL